jgi:hypothetical protein
VAQEANKPVTFTQPFDHKLDLSLQVRGPGRMRVLINGKDFSWPFGNSLQTEDGLISFWGYNTLSYEFPLDPATLLYPKGTPGP